MNMQSRPLSSSTMYVCQLCAKYASRQFESVLRHIGAVHSNESNFNVFCGIEQCPRNFKNYHALRRHIREKHPFMLSRPTSSSSLPEVSSAADQQQPADDSEDAAEQLDQQPEISECERQHCEYAADDDDIRKRTEAIHVLKFKEKYKLSQSTVEDIVGDVGEITADVVSRLHKRVANLLAEKQIAVDDEIEDLFTDTSLIPFRDLKTKHRQDQYFQDHLGLVVSKWRDDYGYYYNTCRTDSGASRNHHYNRIEVLLCASTANLRKTT